MREYFRVPNKVFTLGLTHYELVVLMYLFRCSNNSVAFPSYSTISRCCKIGRRATINAIKSLEQRNFIKVDRQVRKVNHYLVEN